MWTVALMSAALAAEPAWDGNPRLPARFSPEKWRLARQARLHGAGMAAAGPLVLGLGAALGAGASQMRSGPTRIAQKIWFSAGIEIAMVGGGMWLAGVPMVVVGHIAEDHALKGVRRSRFAGHAAEGVLVAAALALVVWPAAPSTGLFLVGGYYAALALEAAQLRVNRKAVCGDAKPPTEPYAWTILPGPRGIAVAGAW